MAADGGSKAIVAGLSANLGTLHLGPEELLVAAKVGVHPEATAVQVAEAIDAAEAAVRAVEPTARAIYLEPDIARSGAGLAGSEESEDSGLGPGSHYR